MLSVASVRSAGGAANYFAADNYYTKDQASGEWFGKGAEALGLTGKIDAAQFEALLKGELPDGTRVGREGIHRVGIDLTFSMPKSWSLIALVGGDKRIIEAYTEASNQPFRGQKRTLLRRVFKQMATRNLFPLAISPSDCSNMTRAALRNPRPMSMRLSLMSPSCLMVNGEHYAMTSSGHSIPCSTA